MTKVFINGTFDIIHPGHLAMINFAKSLGEFLFIGIDSDIRVKELKGPSRPINDQHMRKLLLENLKAVDEVQIFGTDQELIDMIKQCDIMVKGSDYKYKPVIGREVCKELIFFDRLNDYSSTKTIESITNRRHM